MRKREFSFAGMYMAMDYVLHLTLRRIDFEVRFYPNRVGVITPFDLAVKDFPPADKLLGCKWNSIDAKLRAM